MDLTSSSHRRWNPLKKEWVLVSPHRLKRPWQGAKEATQNSGLPSYVADCYLCPGNQRAAGVTNPDYTDTFSFSNDFAAISPFSEKESESSMNSLNGVLRAEPVRGECKVICFSPDHSTTLPNMSVEAISAVIDLWKTEYTAFAANPKLKHVMIFENKGQVMGCSNPHPHCQIWATDSIPHLPLVMANSQVEYRRKYGTNLLTDYAQFELNGGERTICQNDEWLAVVPFWAEWPYEVTILPLNAVANLSELSAKQVKLWAEILKQVTVKYDKLFETSFPYSMGIYQQPIDAQDWQGVVLHQTFLPPLLRSATVKKFMVGYELFAEPQRDITAELAADKLRSL